MGSKFKIVQFSPFKPPQQQNENRYRFRSFTIFTAMEKSLNLYTTISRQKSFLICILVENGKK